MRASLLDRSEAFLGSVVALAVLVAAGPKWW
jgi:hypothetical protein